MTYLITQIWLCLLIAAVLGFIIGWLLKGLLCCDKDASANADLQAQLDACNSKLADANKKTKSAKKEGSVKEKPKAEPKAKAAVSASGIDLSGQPNLLLSSAPSQVDDLKKIKGVGVVLEKLLHELGIYQFEQVAKFDRATIKWVDDRLKFKGRIDRDDWVKQAKKLKDQ